RIRRGIVESAAGSVLMEMGRTRVLCTASFVKELPRWREKEQLGWLTAEYSMLPASTSPRRPRNRLSHTDGRGTEIQRMIGRVLRSVVDFRRLGCHTVYVDCDVLQADGGTRTAAINGGYLALAQAVRFARRQGWIEDDPLTGAVGAVSVGIVQGKVVLDLDYDLDSRAAVDMNVAMTDQDRFVEIQGCAEGQAFTDAQLAKMLRLARRGIRQILQEQRRCLRAE
ncbi:MAG: ribonuclease PH, partial [Sedimentisphaerales bacterium]|nr:ribonuclease PH [Sedimentisphaerales bacterium]